MYALDLNGAQIGHPITYRTPGGKEGETDDITMILHKKNGIVQVRHGKNNRQVNLNPLTEILSVI